MIYIKNDVYAWLKSKEVKKNKTNDSDRLVGRISTSEVDQNGERRYSNWFVTFVGKAREQAEAIAIESPIIIKRCKITNEGYKDESGNYKNMLNMTIFEVELSPKASSFQNDDKKAGSNSNQKTTKSKSKAAPKQEEIVDEADDGLPF